MIFGIENVINCVTNFTFLANLPRRVWWFISSRLIGFCPFRAAQAAIVVDAVIRVYAVSVMQSRIDTVSLGQLGELLSQQIRIGTAQPKRLIVQHCAVDGFDGFRVEVSANDHWALLGHSIDEIEQIFTLFVSQLRQQSTLAGLQMRGGHANFLIRVTCPEEGRYCHLVTLNTPNFQYPSEVVQQFEAVFFVENGAPIGTIVVVDVETRRVRLWEEHAFVVLGGQNFLKELEVIHFLKEKR